MNCKNALKILLVSSQPLSDKEDMIAAKKHLLSCTKCRVIYEEQNTLRNLIHDNVHKYNTPKDLNDKILGLINKQDIHHDRVMGLFKRKTMIPVAISAVLAIIILLFTFALNGSKAHEIVDTITNQHIKFLTAAEQLDIKSSSIDDIESWFNDKLDFHLNIPSLNGINVIGGRICSLFGSKAAVLLYENQHELVSLFIFNKPDLDIYSLKMLDIDGKKLCKGNSKGINLVMWEDRGLTYALVSPLREMELLKLASISGANYRK